MPIYVYRCQACGHKMDVLQKMSATPLTKCPACEEEKLKKQMTSAAFHLKGTGWYETDFKNKDKVPEKTSTEGPSAGNKTDGKKSSEPEATKTPVEASEKSSSNTAKEKSA